MAIMQCSKLQFLFANEQKQLARVLPESSAVICAKFGGVFANSTATQEKRLSFFGAWGGFFKKSPTSYSNYLPAKSQFVGEDIILPILCFVFLYA